MHVGSTKVRMGIYPWDPLTPRKLASLQILGFSRQGLFVIMQSSLCAGPVALLAPGRASRPVRITGRFYTPAPSTRHAALGGALASKRATRLIAKEVSAVPLL